MQTLSTIFSCHLSSKQIQVKQSPNISLCIHYTLFHSAHIAAGLDNSEPVKAGIIPQPSQTAPAGLDPIYRNE